MAGRRDLTHRHFGRLTVLGENGRHRNGTILWKCACDCGRLQTIRADRLLQGRNKSCGCLLAGIRLAASAAVAEQPPRDTSDIRINREPAAAATPSSL